MCFPKCYEIAEMDIRFSIKPTAFVKGLFCVYVILRNMNVLATESSDPVTCCFGTFFVVDGLNCLLHRVKSSFWIVSSWTTVLDYFNCRNNW